MSTKLKISISIALMYVIMVGSALASVPWILKRWISMSTKLKALLFTALVYAVMIAPALAYWGKGRWL